MKNIILIFALAICTLEYSQQGSQKKEIVSSDGISIFYDHQKLYINQKKQQADSFPDLEK